MMKSGLCLLALLMMAGNGLAQDCYESSGLNTAFDFTLDTPFTDYIKTTRRMVEKARVDLNDRNREQVVRANTPFERSPGEGRIQNGILLVHGLSDSPYQMNDLARHFFEKGFLVRTILLPGHGTVPGDMKNVSWESWVKATEYGVHSLSQRVDNLYVGGFSTGGELALYMCLKGYDIKGLFLYAPVTGIKTPFAWFSTTFASPTWLLKQEEKDFARYDSLASNAVAQVYELTKTVDRLLEKKGALTVPVFVALSEDDITVSSEKTMRLFTTRFTSDKNRMIIYSSEPDRHAPDPMGRVMVVDSRIPEQHIVSFSHLSTIVSPDDPHYGKNGDYVYSPHPFLKQSKKGVEPSQVYYGELMRKFKKKHYIQRLSYNPFFRDMTVEMDRFTANTLN